MRITSCLKFTASAVFTILLVTPDVLLTQGRQEAAAASVVPSPIDLNSATKKELMMLEGVSEEIAVKIIRGRPYKSADELKARKVIDEAAYDKIKTKIRIVQNTKATPRKQAPVKAEFGTGPGEK